MPLPKGFKFSEDTIKKMSAARKGKALSNTHKQNISKGKKGKRVGTHLSEETKRKISESNKGRVKSEEHRRKIGISQMGELNHRFGKPHTEETRKKISEANMGHIGYMKGKHHSEETRRKLSELGKGRKLSEDAKRKISVAQKGHVSPLKGKPRTDEVKLKIGISNKGKLVGEKSPLWKGGIKAGIKRYKQKNQDKIKKANKIYKQLNPDVARRNKSKRKRELGFIPLNIWFPHSEAHHVNKNHVIYIPKDKHIINGHKLNNPESMKRINMLALHFLAPGIMPKIK